MRLPIRNAVLTSVILLSACGESRDAADGSAQLNGAESRLPYDSLAIAEDQEIYIGSPFSLVVVPTAATDSLREIWVSDFYSNTILQFDGRGVYRTRLGRAGPGPAEFSTVGQLFLAPNDEIGAVELRRREIKWFSRDSGQLVRNLRFETGSMGISPPVQLEDAAQYHFPLLDPISRTSIGSLDVRSGTWTRTGPLPEPYRRSFERGRGGFASYFRYIFLDRLNARELLLAFSGVDSLYRFAPGDTAAKVIGAVPRLIRRGLEGECRFAADAPDPVTAAKDCGPVRELFSPVSGAWRLEDDEYAVVHTDQHAEGTPPRVVVTGTSYVTILDARDDRACVDLRIPGGSDARTVYDLKGRRLYILDRRVTDVKSTLWLLIVPLPRVADCPAPHRASGWKAPAR